MYRTTFAMLHNPRRPWRTPVSILLVATLATLSIAGQPAQAADPAPTVNATLVINCQASGKLELDKPLGLTGATWSSFKGSGQLAECFQVGVFPPAFFGAQLQFSGVAIQSNCTAAAAFTKGTLTWVDGSYGGQKSAFALYSIASATGGKMEGHVVDGPPEGALVKAIPMSALVTEILNDCANGNLSRVTGTVNITITK